MYGVVHEHDADAFFGEGVHFVPTFANNAGSIGINDDRLSVIQYRFVGRPALNDLCFNI